MRTESCVRILCGVCLARGGAGISGFQTKAERRDAQVESEAGVKLEYVQDGDVDALLPMYWQGHLSSWKYPVID